MSMIDRLMGNAAQTNNEQVQREYADVLIPGESVEAAFVVIRDMMIFTDKRLILVDKQGMTGKKVEYFVIPYKSIKFYSVETAGRFDRDAELKIWVSTGSTPTVSKTLKKGVDIIALQRILAYFMLS